MFRKHPNICIYTHKIKSRKTFSLYSQIGFRSASYGVWERDTMNGAFWNVAMQPSDSHNPLSRKYKLSLPLHHAPQKTSPPPAPPPPHPFHHNFPFPRNHKFCIPSPHPCFWTSAFPGRLSPFFFIVSRLAALLPLQISVPAPEWCELGTSP